MAIIKIKGTEYNINPVRDSFQRRATQFRNNIFENFRKLNLTSDHVEVSEERMALRKAPASASWWMQGHHCHFSYNKMPKYVDNILIVSKVIEFQVNQLLSEKITFEEFFTEFKEEKGFNESRIEARKFFDLTEDHIDLNIINAKYKKLAKTFHPDMPTGSEEKFKELNEHHKTLKRELE